MPTVSVIIPNYNHGAYLKQRIDSVLNQTYIDFEVIILDDCSTDKSRGIIEQYKHEKLSKIVYNEVNSGNTFQQWDKGINLATGKYIWIAESDDWCEPDFLQTIINGLEKNEDTVFGYCQSFCINDREEIIFQSNYKKLEDYCSCDKFIEEFLTFGNAVFNASMAVFKKSFYFKISQHYKSFRFAGDRVFWAELSRLGVVYINARPLNYFRKHDRDVSGKMYSKGLNFIEEIKALDYFHEELHLSKNLNFKAKIKLYNKFLAIKTHIDHALKDQIRKLFFANVSFISKQYFLMLSRLYMLKAMLNTRLNRSLKIY